MTEMPPGRRPGGQQIIPRPNDWQPGPDARWVGARPSLDDVLSGVTGDVALPAPTPESRHSAVLVLLTDVGVGPEVLLTRRSWEMRNHRGEISFPGGRMDPGETATQAALREANEEVGLDSSLVTVHGELEHLHMPVSNSYVVPKVATVTERLDLSPHTGEVERVMWVRLDELTSADTHHSERWHNHFRGEVHFFDLDDETVWGATARILVDLLGRSVR